jgi:hypothetical protein
MEVLQPPNKILQEGKEAIDTETVTKRNQQPTKNSNANAKKSSSRRHSGARNQHRHRHFTRWVLKTFPEAVQLAKEKSQEPPKTCDEHPDPETTENQDKHLKKHQCHILDVAGGKGELSARLTLCHSLRVKLVDPRPAPVLKCFLETVVRSLPKKWQQRVRGQEESALEKILERRFEQLKGYFPCDGTDVGLLRPSSMHIEVGEKNKEKVSQVFPESKGGKSWEETLWSVVNNATLLIGMHADGATEAIVDAALHFRKPFVVVPCCVFPNFFRHRMVLNTDKTKMVPVRSHEQFCQYLASKDSHFVVETLPFEGRNTAVWWDGLHKDGDET